MSTELATTPPVTTANALELDDLHVEYKVRGTWKQVLRGVSLVIAPGESFGLVGESGCGKSTAAFAALKYLPRNGRVSGGSIHVAGEDLLTMSDAAVRRLRQTQVSMVYQNPTSALNPTIRVGDQVAEAFTLQGIKHDDALERSKAMLTKVQISDPTRVMGRYPHQLSGGMNQRVVIAMALAKDPTLLILDEPTTGLDATVEAEVLDLVAALRQEFGTSVLFISHNLDVILRMCDRVGVLYAGRVVEDGPVEEVFYNPRHPYTVGLLRCIPRAGARKDQGRLDTIPGFLPGLGVELPGCVFTERCALAEDICHRQEPDLFEVGGGHHSRCHFHEKAQELPRDTTPVAVTERADRDPSRVPVISTRNVRKTFHQDGHDVRAVEDITFAWRQARRSGSSASRAAGRRPWPASCSG